MFRSLMGRLLVVAVLLTPVRAQASVQAESAGQAITISGMLRYVTTGVPHYSLGDYVILHSDLDQLASLVESEVVIEGSFWTGPTLFMKQAILATRVTAQDQSDLPVSTPGVPDPDLALPPPLDRPVFVPAPPAEFVGSPYYLLVGMVKSIGGRFYLVTEHTAGVSDRLVYSQRVQLAGLVGQRIGAVAESTRHPDGSEQYHILEALVLTADLGRPIQYGTTQIYTAPAGEITVKLRGRRIVMDSAPFVGNGRALIGLRAIAEALEAQVDWNPADQSVTVRLNNRTITVTVGSLRAVVRQDGHPDKVIISDIAPVIVNGRTMVPIRLMSTAIGLRVSWDALSSTIGLQ